MTILALFSAATHLTTIGHNRLVSSMLVKLL